MSEDPLRSGQVERRNMAVGRVALPTDLPSQRQGKQELHHEKGGDQLQRKEKTVIHLPHKIGKTG
jgi:hypothetical protein